MIATETIQVQNRLIPLRMNRSIQIQRMLLVGAIGAARVLVAPGTLEEHMRRAAQESYARAQLARETEALRRMQEQEADVRAIERQIEVVGRMQEVEMKRQEAEVRALERQIEAVRRMQEADALRRQQAAELMREVYIRQEQEQERERARLRAEASLKSQGK